MKRVFAHLGFSAAVMLLILNFFSVTFAYIALGVVLAALCLVLSVPRLRQGVSVWLCLVGAVVACVTFIVGVHATYLPQQKLIGQTAQVQFYVTDVRRGAEKNDYTVKTTAIDLPGVPQNIRSTFSAHADLGDVPDGIYTGKVTFASTGENGYAAWGKFSDGEFQPCYNESIRGCTVFIIQSTFPPSDNLMELLMMIDAARRASAHQVVAVMPYFGWARQDRKDRPRVPIGAKLVANMLMAAGVDRVMTMDLHADQIQGFFDVPVDALYASGIFVPYIKSLNIEDLSIAAPDMGGAKRANTYSKLLGTPIIISHKERAKANVVGSMTAIGEVEGRNIIIVDDMIDTAGTICMAANMLMEKGAKSVRAVITHPVLSGAAYERINDSQLQEVIVTDTIPLNPEKDLHKFTVLTVADIFANVIERVHNYKEISSIFYK